MKSMKEAGATEVAGVKKRTIRSLAMDRIAPDDCTYITTRLDEIAERIVQMKEKNESKES